MTDHPTTPEQVIAAMRDAVVGRRARYGEPADFCAAVAKRWSLDLARFGIKIEPWMVTVMMNSFKVERILRNPHHTDSAVDGGGYLVMLPSVVAACTPDDGEGGGDGA